MELLFLYVFFPTVFACIMWFIFGSVVLGCLGKTVICIADSMERKKEEAWLNAPTPETRVHFFIPFLAWISDLRCWKWKTFWKTLGLLIGCIPAMYATLLVMTSLRPSHIMFFGQMCTVAFFWLVTMTVLIRGLKSTSKC